MIYIKLRYLTKLSVSQCSLSALSIHAFFRWIDWTIRMGSGKARNYRTFLPITSFSSQSFAKRLEKENHFSFADPDTAPINVLFLRESKASPWIWSKICLFACMEVNFLRPYGKIVLGSEKLSRFKESEMKAEYNIDYCACKISTSRLSASFFRSSSP